MKKLMMVIFLYFILVSCTQNDLTETTTEAETTIEQTTNETSHTTMESTVEITTDEILTGEQYPVFSGVYDRSSQLPEEVNLLENITAIDPQDGDITDDIVVDAPDFDNATAGTYTINLYVIDSDGNRTDISYTFNVFDNLFNAESDLNSIELSMPLELPKFGLNNTFFYWSSNNKEVINSQGYIIYPPVGSDPVEVTLTCRASNGPISISKDFVLTIQPNPEVVITRSVDLPFDNESIRYTLDETATLQIFYEENGNIPYVDIEAFLAFLDGSIDFSLLNFTYNDEQLLIEYTQEHSVFEGYIANGTYTALFDFTDNTLTVSSYDFFRGYITPSGLNPYESIIYQSHESGAVTETTIPLGDYNVDLVKYDDGSDLHYLMPFHIAKLIFLSGHRFNVYYNGVKITGYDDAYVAWDENELDPALYEMNFGPLNDEDLPKDLKIASYHFLALTFDYFHGIKDEDSMDSLYEMIYPHAETIIEGDENDFVETVWKTLINIDDPGTWYSRVGYYDDNPLSYLEPSYIDSHGRLKAFFEEFFFALEVIDEGLGTQLANESIGVENVDEYLPEVRLIDDDTTAIIYIVDFFAQTTDDVITILDNLPEKVENIIFDTSVSFFGEPQIALELLGLMTDQPITYSLKNTFDGQISTYDVVVDQPYYEYNYFIISSGFTYGMANVFMQLAKDNQLAVIIGQQSSGGTCPLTSITVSDGTNFMMTSSMMFMRRMGNDVDGYTYESYEFGIEPDYVLDNYATESELIEIINQIENS